ncbi:hypothetical protein [Acinetobacter phage A832.1]|nr:hypothetical protein [Acinetobacter phage A832.1]
MIPLSPSMMIGFKKPNSLMLDAICNTCSSLCNRELLAYGIRSDVLTFFIEVEDAILFPKN